MIAPATQPSNADIARHYDELDPFYRELWGEHLHHGYWRTGEETAAQATLALTELVADSLALRHGDRVCDAGCGYGATARLLAERHRARVTAFTLSAAQLHASRARADDAVDIRLADWCHNRLPDAYADAVLAIESTEHMHDKPRFFREAARVLRPGGRLAVCAWIAAPHTTPWQRRRLLEPICREGRLAGLGTTAEYRRWIADAGLRHLETRDLTAHVRRTWDLCLRRMLRHLTRPRAWSYLLDRRNVNRHFALTVARIWLAYRTGCLRYALFVARADDA